MAMGNGPSARVPDSAFHSSVLSSRSMQQIVMTATSLSIAGLDTAASSVSLERSHGDGRSRPFEVASTARSDPNTSDRGYGSYSKLSCSDSGAGDTVDQPSVHPATSISTHQAGAEHEDIRGASGTDYSYSEADTEL